MADTQLPEELPVPGALSAAPHVHFRRYRELLRLHAAMVELQRRRYTPESGIGPVVLSVLNTLASAQRAFYFFSEARRDEAVAAMAARSMQVEPPPEPTPAPKAKSKTRRWVSASSGGE